MAGDRVLYPAATGAAGRCLGYGFVDDRTFDVRKFRILTVMDEFIRECQALPPKRQLRNDDVLATLTDLFIGHCPPEDIRSDSSPQFIAIDVNEWLGRVGVSTPHIEKASRWENDDNESFRGKLRDELLIGEIFYTLAEARFWIEAWSRHYTTKLRTVHLGTARRHRKRSRRQAIPPAPLCSVAGMV